MSPIRKQFGPPQKTATPQGVGGQPVTPAQPAPSSPALGALKKKIGTPPMKTGKPIFQ